MDDEEDPILGEAYCIRVEGFDEATRRTNTALVFLGFPRCGKILGACGQTAPRVES